MEEEKRRRGEESRGEGSLGGRDERQPAADLGFWEGVPAESGQAQRGESLQGSTKQQGTQRNEVDSALGV